MKGLNSWAVLFAADATDACEARFDGVTRKLSRCRACIVLDLVRQ
jgi:hypothetical protein